MSSVVNWLESLVSEMTCYVSCVTFNPTHCSVLTPRGDQNTQLHSSVNSTSWKFWSEFCFSCVFWHIVVFMEGSIIPDWVTALNYLRWCSSPLQIGQHVCSARAVNSLLHTRRLSIFMLMPRTTCHVVSDPQHPWLHFVSNSRPCRMANRTLPPFRTVWPHTATFFCTVPMQQFTVTMSL